MSLALVCMAGSIWSPILTWRYGIGSFGGLVVVGLSKRRASTDHKMIRNQSRRPKESAMRERLHD
jgi:hypothetical protein